MGRLTAMLDDVLIEEARKVLATRTKRETIEAALREVIRRARVRKALEHRGRMDFGFAREDLLHRREPSRR